MQGSPAELNPSQLSGIVPPLITPLNDEEALDLAALRRLIDRVLDGGVSGLFLLGSTGEFTSLHPDLRRAVIDEACAHVAGRVPVVVNVSDTCLAQSKELADHAYRAGATAVAICPPYYFPLNQQELLHYVYRFCDVTPLPVFLYNIPQYAHAEFALEAVARLVEVRNVAGLKNSDGSAEYVRAARQLALGRPDFSILMGNEEVLMAAMAAGANGGVCGGANMFPALYVLLCKAVWENQYSEAMALQNMVVRVANAVYRIGPANSSYLRGLKCALSLIGVARDVLLDPLMSFTAQERDQLQLGLDELLPEIERLTAPITQEPRMVTERSQR
jgi:dihydrodipicolinate synthase/N-acetylneuraminate lyase